MKTVIVTGGYGFIGSNFIKYLANNYNDISIHNIDKLTYAANKDNLKELVNYPGTKLFNHDYDLAWDWTAGNIQSLVDQVQPDWVVHFAAESHVDNSIESPQKFIDNNVSGTLNLLNGLRRANHKTKLLHISTDEVYGSLDLNNDGESRDTFMEHEQMAPSSPYAASKVAAEAFIIAYGRTYNQHYIITRSSNNFGPNQHKEKFIPKAITRILNGQPILLYGRGINIRDWIYVEDNCRAIHTVMEKGMVGEIYNIGTGQANINNEQLAIQIARMAGGNEHMIQFIKDRPGHDLKYNVDIFKINQLGWRPRYLFLSALQETINWYKNNHWFWK